MADRSRRREEAEVFTEMRGLVFRLLTSAATLSFALTPPASSVTAGAVAERPVASMASLARRLCFWRPYSSRFFRRVRRLWDFPWRVLLVWWRVGWSAPALVSGSGPPTPSRAGASPAPTRVAFRCPQPFLPR